MKLFIIFLASGFFSGYIPLASGTAGTIVGVFVYLLFASFPPGLYLLSTVAVFFLALWASAWAEMILEERDSPIIVIDEIEGFLVTMFLLPQTLSVIFLGFLFFRIFDIIKVPPAGAINDRMKGGLAVVLDDVVSGIYANLLLHALLLIFPKYFP